MQENYMEWSDSFSVGVALIDEQHKELVNLTNDLYGVCDKGEVAAREMFYLAVKKAAAYVRYHFSTEEQIMERVEYPKLQEHKQEHASFAQEVLDNVKKLEEGKFIMPIQFVNFLRDWILTHIAVMDTDMGNFLKQLKKSGKLEKITVKLKKPF